jgi:hypothetical protein
MMLKFKVDENLPTEAAELLASVGHDAMTVRDQHIVGSPTPTWLGSAGKKSVSW